MNLDQIATKCFILALFIRDDGERLLLGDGFYDFKSNLQHFQANTIANDVVEIQGDNGQLLAGQVMRSGAQKFEGYIGDATTNRQTVEQKRSDFMAFFRIKHFYKVVYILPDGTAIQRRRGYLTDAPTIPEIFQKFPEYSVALNFEDANYYEYAEDEHGDEIYAHIAELALAGGATGGLVWDAIGAVTNGITWSGIQTAQGEYIQVTNELDIPAKLASVEMLGKAEQDGTPTPDSPVPVQVVTGEQTVKITGKNLASFTSMTQIMTAQVTVAKTDSQLDLTITAANRYANIQFATGVKVKNGDTVTISAHAKSTESGVIPNYRIGKGGAVSFFSGYATATPSGDGYNLEKTITADGDYELYILFYPVSNIASADIQTLNTATFTNFQIELGSTATAYEPYQGQEFEVNLGSIELAKIGNYQDRIYKDSGKRYIEKQTGKVVLNGTENWGYNSNDGVFVVSDLVDYLKTGFVPISDYYTGQNISRYGQLQNMHISFLRSSTGNRTVVKNTNYTSAADFKTWLQSHNTTVYYALATPTTTEITNEALIAQLDALGASSLFVGVNNIGTETQNAVPTLKIEYYTEVDLDGAGYEWEPGGNTAKTIVTVAGVDSAWPIWTVQGGAQNPTLTNITTGQTITWQGFVPEGQTLTINMAEMTADLAGANVFEYITGEWIRLAPGNNTLVYTAGSADKPSTLSWNGVLA